MDVMIDQLYNLMVSGGKDLCRDGKLNTALLLPKLFSRVELIVIRTGTPVDYLTCKDYQDIAQDQNLTVGEFCKRYRIDRILIAHFMI